MTVFPVLLDSCVLYPMYLRDTLLRMAEAELYHVYWSQEILNGATRNLVEAGRMTDSKAMRLQELLKNAFPEAMVEVSPELIAVMSNDPGDRHVLAAAVVAQATVIVTFNLKHFPSIALNPWGIEAQHPDVFLTHLYYLFPDSVTAVVQHHPSNSKPLVKDPDYRAR
jgi:predicted nucleic acid-binding protein